MFFHSGHKRGLRLLHAAAETPTDEGGAEAASAAASRGRPSAKFSIHAQGTKWIAVRLDRPRKYDSMVESLLKKLGSREGWTLLPYGSDGGGLGRRRQRGSRLHTGCRPCARARDEEACSGFQPGPGGCFSC